MNAKDIFLRSLNLLESGDARAWCDLFADSGVLEFPYAPPGWPSRFEGKDVIWNHMQIFPEFIEIKFINIEIYEMSDPEFVIGEFQGDGYAKKTKREFIQTYISVLRTRNGKIQNYRDYWNPNVHIGALGDLTAEDLGSHD